MRPYLNYQPLSDRTRRLYNVAETFGTAYSYRNVGFTFRAQVNNYDPTREQIANKKLKREERKKPLTIGR